VTSARVGEALDVLFDTGRTFVTSVPDKGLAGLIDAVASDARFSHVPCTREEEAVGLCAGAAFAGRRTVLLMQNSGIGNAINGLTSLTSFYTLPLLLLISMRGGAGERIAAQRPMGRATLALLAACEISVVQGADGRAVVDALRRGADDRIAIVAAPDVWAGLTS
jgi:sulfopyruvate decarboxylase subunit alpha